MISSEQLSAVSEWLGQQGANILPETEMRSNFPDMHLTFCSDDDVMSDKPVAETERFNLYLVDSSEHCLSLTSDMQQASGLVVAELEDE